jgi:hypothetical protein
MGQMAKASEWKELLSAIKAALPANTAKHGGVFINVAGDHVHKIEMKVEDYQRLLDAIAKIERQA